MIAQLTTCLVNKVALRDSGELEATGCFNESPRERDKAVAGVHPSRAPSPPQQLLCATILCSQNNPKQSCLQGRASTVPCHGPTCSQVRPGECQGVNTAGQAHSNTTSAGWSCFPVQNHLLPAMSHSPVLSTVHSIWWAHVLEFLFFVEPISNIYKRCKKSAGVLITHWAQNMVRDSPRLLPREGDQL